MNDQPTAGSPPLIKDDFADWLSPMLVKELRQGVRTRVFVAMFILLQVLLLTVTAFSLLYASVSQRAEGVSALFWTMVGLPVLLVLPLGGLNAIGGEVKANTLELIFLTRLTAFRIVVGKWLAIFVQSLLLVCTVLPYLVLRYFIGGINISVELETLGVMLAISAVFTACAVGISGYPTRVVRGASVIGVILILIFGLGVFGSIVGGSRIVGGGPGAPEWFEMLAGGALLLVIMLEIGVMKIAPPAENHAGMLRLLGFAGLALAAAVASLARDSRPFTVGAAVLAYGLCVVALCEAPRHIGSIYRPFARRGLLGCAVGRLFYPGWPSGVLFTLAMFIGFGGLMAYQKMFKEPAAVVLYLAFLGTILLPMAVIRLCLPRGWQPAAPFFAIQLACTIATFFCVACDDAVHTHLKSVCAILPLSVLIMGTNDSAWATTSRLGLVAVTTGGSLILLLLSMRKPLLEMRNDERASLDQPAPAEQASPDHAALA